MTRPQVDETFARWSPEILARVAGLAAGTRYAGQTWRGSWSWSLDGVRDLPRLWIGVECDRLAITADLAPMAGAEWYVKTRVIARGVKTGPSAVAIDGPPKTPREALALEIVDTLRRQIPDVDQLVADRIRARYPEFFSTPGVRLLTPDARG